MEDKIFTVNTCNKLFKQQEELKKNLIVAPRTFSLRTFRKIEILATIKFRHSQTQKTEKKEMLVTI